jgi:hypothetical protein
MCGTASRKDEKGYVYQSIIIHIQNIFISTDSNDKKTEKNRYRTKSYLYGCFRKPNAYVHMFKYGLYTHFPQIQIGGYLIVSILVKF